MFAHPLPEGELRREASSCPLSPLERVRVRAMSLCSRLKEEETTTVELAGRKGVARKSSLTPALSRREREFAALPR